MLQPREYVVIRVHLTSSLIIPGYEDGWHWYSIGVHHPKVKKPYPRGARPNEIFATREDYFALWGCFSGDGTCHSQEIETMKKTIREEQLNKMLKYIEDNPSLISKLIT